MGRAISHIQVIEFQKRGLPHAHLLLKLANEDVPTVDEFDKYVVNNRNTQGKFEGFEGTYTKNVVYPEVLTAGS